MKDLDSFWITEDELMRRSYEPRYRGKPLAWVFYEIYRELEKPEQIPLSVFSNFYNRISEEHGTFELLFSDNSFFIFGTGKYDIFHPPSGFFEHISSD